MTEFEDLRGRTFFWTRRQEHPFECSLYEHSTRVGLIIEQTLIHRLWVGFAGIDWQITPTGKGLRTQDRVTLADGRILVAQGTRDRVGYTLSSEDGRTFRLCRINPYNAVWLDEDGGDLVTLRCTGNGFGNGGEISVMPLAPLLQAPILVVLGTLRAVRHGLFTPKIGDEVPRPPRN